jgi:hypothetical protein
MTRLALAIVGLVEVATRTNAVRFTAPVRSEYPRAIRRFFHWYRCLGVSYISDIPADTQQDDFSLMMATFKTDHNLSNC